MRKITFLAAVAATLCTVACNKNMDGRGRNTLHRGVQQEHGRSDQ